MNCKEEALRGVHVAFSMGAFGCLSSLPVQHHPDRQFFATVFHCILILYISHIHQAAPILTV